MAATADHILPEGSIDATLGSDSVTSRREELGNTGSVEASFRETESGTQSGTTSADDDGIVLVILRRTRRKSLSVISQAQLLTITGYFSEMYSLAALARSGWLATIRAGRRQVSEARRNSRELQYIPAGRVEEKRRL